MANKFYVAYGSKGYDGSTAGTSLRQSLVALMNPSVAALGVFEELGLTFDDVNPATNDLATIIDRLGNAGMDTAQAMKVFGARAGPGMLALMSAGGDAVRDMTVSITGTSKASDMAATQLNTLQGQVKILKSELEEIAISFGDVLIPIIRQFIQKYISPLTAKLMGLSMGTKKNIVTIALLAAAIGPLLLVVGKLIGSIGTIMKVGSMLFSKVGLIIAAIAAVVGVVTYLWKTNEDFRNAVTKIWEKVKAIILNAVNAIKDWWAKNGQKLINKVVSAVKAIWKVIKTIFNKIKPFVVKVWNFVKDVIIDVVTAIRKFWETHGEKIWNTVKTIFTNIWMCVKSAFSIIGDALNKFFSYVRPIWETYQCQLNRMKGVHACRNRIQDKLTLQDAFIYAYNKMKTVLMGGEKAVFEDAETAEINMRLQTLLAKEKIYLAMEAQGTMTSELAHQHNLIIDEVLALEKRKRQITKADWNRVQKEREIRTSQRGYSPTGKAGYSSKYAFSNKLFCVACGSKFRRHKYDTVQKTVYTWVCINHKRYKNCKQDAIKEEDLERTFIGIMRDIVTDKDGFINKVIANIEEVVKNRQSETSTEEIDAKIISICCITSDK